jgi:ribosomal protein S18 acetylase RimI-like enzyme
MTEKKLKIKIRKAKLSDVNAVYKIGVEMRELGFSGKYKFHQKAELREFAAPKKDNVFLVAEANGHIVGFVYAKIIDWSRPGWGMLDNLAVKEEYRKHGIGTHLTSALYKELKKRHVHYVQILEEIHHKNTRKFWKEKGFKETKVFVWAERNI